MLSSWKSVIRLNVVSTKKKKYLNWNEEKKMCLQIIPATKLWCR